MRCARCGSRDVEESPATRISTTWFRCHRCGQAMRPPHKTLFYLMTGIGAPIVGILLAIAVYGMAGTQMPRRVWTLLVMMPVAALFFGAMSLVKLCYPQPRLDRIPDADDDDYDPDIPMIDMGEPDDDLSPRRPRRRRQAAETGFSFGWLVAGMLGGGLVVALIAGGLLVYVLRTPGGGQRRLPK